MLEPQKCSCSSLYLPSSSFKAKVGVLILSFLPGFSMERYIYPQAQVSSNKSKRLDPIISSVSTIFWRAKSPVSLELSMGRLNVLGARLFNLKCLIQNFTPVGSQYITKRIESAKLASRNREGFKQIKVLLFLIKLLMYYLCSMPMLMGYTR